MTDVPNSPWATRFPPLLDKEEIRRRATRHAIPVSSIHELPVEAACKALADAIRQVCYPTAQFIDVLHQLIERALGHCLLRYPDMRSFSSNIYRQEPPLPKFVPPTCLTGLAGIGKSCLADALVRVLPADGHILCPPESSPFPLKSLWKIDVQTRSSLKDIFAPLGGVDGSLADQLKTARKRAYRDGVSLVLADEFQFLTASSSANTRISQTLIFLGYCGLPAIYIANYSLLHRLLRRPQEDRDRLLSDVILMAPDGPESDDWTQTLAALVAVAPDVFRIDPVGDGPRFHRYCAGIKRTAGSLLVAGYRVARMQRLANGNADVTMAHIQAAYHSVPLTALRADTEIITQQFILGRQVDRQRRDLWCPLGQSATLHANLVQDLTRRRGARVAEEIQRAATTEEERGVIEEYSSTSTTGNTSSVVKLPHRKRPTAETLKANAASLHDL